jgi:hypothetical protein|tara:strand:- start:108295 stop:108639 length:345 start_codon:yes stop_codon:yes gene_type:complete
MLTIAVMVGFFVMAGIRMAPSYFEYMAVRDVVERVAQEHDPATETIADIRRRISNLFNTNQIYGLKPGDIEIYREDGQTWIDARYEARIPLVANIDAVISFDDLLVEAGERRAR